MEKMAKAILENVGGKENIETLTHCATRLRFSLHDEAKADQEVLKNLDGVLGVATAGGQLQVIIGPMVEQAYDDVVKEIGGSVDTVAKEKKALNQGNILKRLLDIVLNTVSRSFTPMIPALAGAGLIKALLAFMNTMAWIDTTGATFGILSAASNSFFYFLPIFVAISLAKNKGANIYVAGAIAASLLEPSFTALASSDAALNFIGIPVVMMDYSSSVFPAIIAISVFVVLEKFLKKIINKNISIVAVPTLSILIMVPLTVLVVGPMGNIIGEGLMVAMQTIVGLNLPIAGFVLGVIWIFVVVFGLHWAIIPLLVTEMATGSSIMGSMLGGTIFAPAGVALGVFIKSRDPKFKAVSFTAFTTAILGGITEPIIYGILFKYKKTLGYALLFSGICGLMNASFGVGAFSAAGGIFSLFATDKFGLNLISSIVSFVGPLLLVLIFGYKSQDDETLSVE